MTATVTPFRDRTSPPPQLALTPELRAAMDEGLALLRQHWRQLLGVAAASAAAEGVAIEDFGNAAEFALLGHLGSRTP